MARTEPGGPIVGVAAWEGPDAGRVLNVIHQLREAPLYLRAIGPTRLWPALNAVTGFTRSRPTTPHWYLADIAVSGDARGLGVGSTILRYRLDAIDAAGLSAYLEATSPANRRLYERHGFIAQGAIDTKGAGLTAMLRPAGGPTPPAHPTGGRDRER